MGLVSPMRPACHDGVVVANGLFYWGPWMCRCDGTQIGVISLGSGGSFDYAAEAKDGERREGSGGKPATLETGLVVQVPQFISEGEVIRVDTADGKYLERAK